MAHRGTRYTLPQLNSQLDILMDDTSDARWTSAQKDLALQVAVRAAKGIWWEEREDDTNTYDMEDFRYDLPPACEGVQAVFFAALSSDQPRYFVVPSMWHIENYELVFEQAFPKYDGQTLYIAYFVYPNNLLHLTAADGVASGATFTSATSTFVTYLVMPGDEVFITGDSGLYYVKTVDSETQLTLHTSPTAGSSKTFYVARYTDMPFTYLTYRAMAELYEMASRNKPGVEVEENMRWATYYRQLATRELELKRRTPSVYRRY